MQTGSTVPIGYHVLRYHSTNSTSVKDLLKTLRAKKNFHPGYPLHKIHKTRTTHCLIICRLIFLFLHIIGILNKTALLSLYISLIMVKILCHFIFSHEYVQ